MKLLQSLKEHFLPSAIHPHKNEMGDDVVIERPTLPSSVDDFNHRDRTAVVTPLSKNVPKSLNGVAFNKFDATNHDWSTDSGINKSLHEPEINTGHSTKRIASGIIMKEPDGRYWIHEPTNHFAYTEHSFPKGKLDGDLSNQANAIKETFEETGLKAKILKHIGDVERTTSIARYYLGERTGGNPAHMGWESQSVKLVPKEKLKDYLNLKLDHDLVDKLD